MMALSNRMSAAAPLIAIGLLHAQVLPPPPRYTYEVVSVHRADPNERNSGFSPGAQGGLRARNDTAMQLLTFAYDARDYQFVGVPGWAQSERYNVNLTPDRTEVVLDETTDLPKLEGWLTRNRQRIQAVLRDRFGLVLRAETRELPMSVLTVAKRGSKLEAPADPKRGPSFSINNGRQIVAKSSTMKMLADSLSRCWAATCATRRASKVSTTSRWSGRRIRRRRWRAPVPGRVNRHRRLRPVACRSLLLSLNSSGCGWTPRRAQCRYS